MAMREWVKLPTDWIQDRSLADFRWSRGDGSDNVAALMTLVVLAHHAGDSGIARLTYDQIEVASGLSRSKISAGLAVLAEREIISRGSLGRSIFGFENYETSAWGKLPARRLYAGGCIAAFAEFHLRKRIELDALKMFLLVVARRDNRTNLANISYDKIGGYLDIERHHIKGALNLLAANGLVFVEHIPSGVSSFGIANAYRLPYIAPYVHLGTMGRGLDSYDL